MKKLAAVLMLLLILPLVCAQANQSNETNATNQTGVWEKVQEGDDFLSGIVQFISDASPVFLIILGVVFIVLSGFGRIIGIILIILAIIRLIMMIWGV
jgi:hypothetical protein